MAPPWCHLRYEPLKLKHWRKKIPLPPVKGEAAAPQAEKHHPAKADPDAVLFPGRLRRLLRPHTEAGAKRFLLGCKEPAVRLPGSAEVISRGALQTYFWSTDKDWKACTEELPWQTWGEDTFMQKCLSMLGMEAVPEFGWVVDHGCAEGDCSDEETVVFHRQRDEQGWLGCWAAGVQG